MGSYRTVCVRTCDGYFFPISFATSSARFGEDAAKCASMCGGAKTELFVYRLPGETLEDAKSLSGASYNALPDALRYQREYVKGCTCQMQEAVNMLDTVRKARIDAETRQAEVETVSATTEESALAAEPEVIDETNLRNAKVGVRDVLVQPAVDPEVMANRAVISYDTFPPLPIRRPDPLAGKQISLAQ